MTTIERFRLDQSYKGFRISGNAASVDNYTKLHFAVGLVWLQPSESSCLSVDHFQDPLLKYEDEQLAAWFGLGLAQIAVDSFLPPPTYYLTPMNVAWAVDILRCGAVEFMQREIQRPKLFEALDYLEKTLDKAWLVRRYRRALRGDCRHWRDKREKRENLRGAARGIQQACAAQLVKAGPVELFAWFFNVVEVLAETRRGHVL